jgi:hypothetical protein
MSKPVEMKKQASYQRPSIPFRATAGFPESHPAGLYPYGSGSMCVCTSEY